MQEYVDRLPDSLTAVAGDLEQDFERLLVDSSPLAFRVAYGVLRNREDAEDVAQEAFLRAHRSMARLRDRDRFRPWIVRMTWRLSIDRQRSNRRRLQRDHTHVQDAPAASNLDPALASERNQLVWKAIDDLPEKLRIVIVLSGIQGHDIQEVAALLGVPAGTVKSRLFHARERMREALRCMMNHTP